MITAVPIKLSNYTKPGQLVESRMKTESTMQVDPPEFVNTCLNCTLAQCKPDASFCLLKSTDMSKDTRKNTKAGKPDMRRKENRPKPQPDELDLRIFELLMNGGTKSWIARELSVELWKVQERIKKLERIGML